MVKLLDMLEDLDDVQNVYSNAVSYTHLDVYKRQAPKWPCPA